MRTRKNFNHDIRRREGFIKRNGHRRGRSGTQIKKILLNRQELVDLDINAVVTWGGTLHLRSDVASLSLSGRGQRARAESGWKEIVSALTEARKLLPTFN